MSNGVTRWLEELGLGKYLAVFAENDIDTELLLQLTDDDLKELGVASLGHRKKMLNAIGILRSEEVRVATSDLQSISVSIDKAEAERRQLTVMFCDLVGSTELSQQLDPEDLRDVNRAYQDACKAAIERYDGYVARYMGDGVLAYFGYPQAHEDDAERAIHAGLRVVESMAELNAAVGDKQGVELGVRVGIATGPVVVGDLIGEGASQESAVVGETPNLAARLQGMASTNNVVIASSTYDLAGGRFEYEELGTHEVKGIAEAVRVWQVVAPSVSESRFEALHKAGVTPLVGREHEIGLLLERWEYAKEGDGQVVFLSGEPGIGKSRISETLRERAATGDPIRLRYQCSPYHTNSALHPVIEQLERAARLESEDLPKVKLEKLESLISQATQEINVIAPLFASLLSIPVEGRYAPLEMTPERQKEATLEALVAQMDGLSRKQPVLLIFEDVHWADPTSLELLGLIVDRAQSVPVLVVITFRPEFSPPWTGHSHVTSLTLNRFSHSLAFKMVDEVTGGKPLPDEVRDQIIEKTDGVPLFVEELTKTVIESGLLEDRGDLYALTAPLPPLAIPSTLHDSLMARLDRLGRVREVAQTAAVIGREFSHGLLAAVSPLTQNELRDALAQLMDAALIFRRGTPPRVHYVFKHALVQDAAYESLLKSKRRELHGRIAKALEAEFAENVETEPELLAHHYTEAAITEPALDYWLRAGQRAAERCAYVEASTHLERGLALVETLPEGEPRIRKEIRFRVALGVPLLRGTGAASPEVAENYSRAQGLCEELGETEQLFPVLWGLWYHHMNRFQVRRACELADRLLEVGLGRNDEALRLEAHHCQWASRCLVGELGAALEHSEQGLQLYRAEDHHALTFTYGGHDPGACACDINAIALWLLGYPERASERFDAGFGLVQKLGHSGTLNNAIGNRLLVSMFQRDKHAVAQYSETLLELAQVEGGESESLANVARGWATFEEGKREAGLGMMRESVNSQVWQDPWNGPMISLMAVALGQHGDVDEALELVNELLRLSQRDDVHWWEAELRRVKGELLLLSTPDDPGSAEGWFKQAIEIARAQSAKSLELRAAVSLARLWQDQGNSGEARDLLAPVFEWFTEGFETAELKDAKALLKQLS
ncbi:MAG: AAA family ATPase [Gammaproteobacteria bacterium]|nr:AAA family ATPase [Gammaproteobacteria bacterium]